MCHPSTANWGSFGDRQIKPSTRLKVEMSCPQLTSVDPQGPSAIELLSRFLKNTVPAKLSIMEL